MKNTTKIKRFSKVFLILSLIVVVFTGCAKINDWFATKKGTLLGNSYTIRQFDNEGNPTLTITGSHIDIEPYDPQVSDSGDLQINSVLDITIDGNQILTVGNTLIFEEKGIPILATFEELDAIESDSLINYIPFDKMINGFKNDMGKQRLIVIYSQFGKPIGVYEGDSVYVTIPNDLPKMTRLNVDGKSLYLHRVNYTIIDKNLMD